MLTHNIIFCFLCSSTAGYYSVNLSVFVHMQVEVQCEQLSRELARQREQLDRDAHGLQQRLAEAREEGRAEARKQKEELTNIVSLTFHVHDY